MSETSEEIKRLTYVVGMAAQGIIMAIKNHAIITTQANLTEEQARGIGDIYDKVVENCGLHHNALM